MKHLSFYLTAYLAAVFFAALMAFTPALANQEPLPPEDRHVSYCQAFDTQCLSDTIMQSISEIENTQWKDQSYRDLARALAQEKKTNQAIALIKEISNPDTKAMTIRAIGMEIAKHHASMDEASLSAVFTKLDEQAQMIPHEGARAIAYTYIAMAQAFAHLDAAATQTSKAMTNDALRNKAFAETAEIQAERGDIEQALASIKHISAESYRNKAYATTSHIFMKQNAFEHALRMAQHIKNPYKRSTALLNIYQAQNKQSIKNND